MLARALSALKAARPLVHAMTNPVTMNDCANALLAVGARAIMAEDEREAGEIAARCDALVLNTGVPNEARLRGMLKAGRAANQKRIPVVLDPVGAGASAFRRSALNALMEQLTFSVIRANRSEVRALLGWPDAGRGVDAEGAAEDDWQAARLLAERTGAVVVMTGETDVATDGHRLWLIKGGHPDMARITGCGCMLSAITGAFCAANGDMMAAATAAAAMMGACGRRAADATIGAGLGTGSMRVWLMDELSLMTPERLGENADVEYIGG